jgi:N-acetylneuraminic acid mutarotase
MPKGLTTFGVVNHHSSVYVLGGYFGTPHAYSKNYQSPDFARLDLATGAWEKLPPVEPIQSVAMVSDGTYVYRIGGMRAMNAEGQDQDLRSVSEVDRFDTTTKTWTRLTDLPEPRSSHVALMVGTQVYVIGGWKLAGDPSNEEWNTTLAVADLSQPKLEWQVSPTPFKARAFGAATLGDKLMVFGGLTPDDDESKSVFVYDTAAKTWSRGPDFPGQSISIRATSWKGNVYANGSDGVVYQLSADQKSWQPGASFLYPRLFHELISDEQTGPLVFGGIPSEARGARIRVVEQLSATPPQAGVVWSLPTESAAKNRQGAFVSGQQLYAFGGNNSLEQHDFEKERFVKTARRLDLGTLEWKALADFPAARQSMQALWLEGDKPSLLAIGGFGWGKTHLAGQSEVFSYDPQSDKWSPASALPQPLSQFGTAVYGDAVWVLGGLDYDTSREKNDQFKHSSAILRLDLKTAGSKFVDAGFGLGEPRRAFAGALLGDRYYIVGGMKEDFALVPTCQAVDLKARSVSTFTCPRATRLSAELVPLGGKLYLVAGSAKNGDDVKPDTSVEVYDPTTDRWSVLTETLPLADTAQLRAFAFRDRLLIYTAQHDAQSVEVALLDPKAISAGATEYKKLSGAPGL